MTGARISDVRVAAAHEGVAELVVTLTYENGGLSEVTLDDVAASALFRATQTTTPEELIGTPWHQVRDALTTAYNRFNNAH